MGCLNKINYLSTFTDFNYHTAFSANYSANWFIATKIPNTPIDFEKEINKNYFHVWKNEKKIVILTKWIFEPW